MEQADRVSVTEGGTRSHHLVYTLPHTGDALAQVLAPALERVDVREAPVQLVVLTADAETAMAVSEVVYRLAGPQGIEVLPVTSANRAARLIEERPIHAVAGTPLELQTLVQRSTLKLGDVRTVILAWADDIVESGPDAVASLEALFAEIPKEAGRVIVAKGITDPVEQLIERYARQARRIAPQDESVTENLDTLTVQYVSSTATSRAATLRRLLDELDPPSAAVVARSDESARVAAETLRQLGYRHPDARVRVTTGDVSPGTHTVILFDAPARRAELASLAGIGAVQVVALVTPRELHTMRALAPNLVPLMSRTPGTAARQRDRVLRDELLAILGRGVALRETLALEPLLEQYDGVEIAAAAVRLLERERERERARPPVTPPPAPAPSFSREERRGDRAGRSERGADERRDRRPPPRRDRDQQDRRPARPFAGRPDRGERPRGDRPRGFGGRPRDDRHPGERGKDRPPKDRDR